MPTPTTRLQMQKPLGPEAQDVAVLNANYDLLDLNAGARQCTSGTRPGSPFRGMIIEETDTGQTYWYNGTKWQWLGGAWNLNISRSTNFTAAASSTSTTIGGITTVARSSGPNIANDGTTFTLPEGFWMIRGEASVASVSGQALQIYHVSSGTRIAEQTFTEAGVITAATALIGATSTTTDIQLRYRNTTAGGVIWSNARLEIVKISPFN